MTKSLDLFRPSVNGYVYEIETWKLGESGQIVYHSVERMPDDYQGFVANALFSELAQSAEAHPEQTPDPSSPSTE